MKRKWIGFSMIIMMLLFGSCGAKDENLEQNSSLATDESAEEEIFQNTEKILSIYTLPIDLIYNNSML